MNKRGSVALGPKPTKACVNCRRLKASALHDLFEESQQSFNASHSADQQSILDRLDRIEAALGINQEIEDLLPNQVPDDEEESDSAIVQGVWKAVAHLRSITRPPPDEKIWTRTVVKRLWSRFLNNLPLLHFLKSQDSFKSPTPLLLASVLYISSLHHQSFDQPSMEAGYFAATCSAIVELVTPALKSGPTVGDITVIDTGADVSKEQKSYETFHNILGLIMASLSSEAYIDTTGSWIAIAYRLWLDHCPSDLESSTLDWRGLFSGLQIIDIEHASMHMSYPIIPRQGLRQVETHQGHAFQGLADMMHYGLSHFVGRGLPTIWSSINEQPSHSASAAPSSFTDHDSEVIRLWACKLDDWLVQYNGSSQPTPSDRQGILILLHYHLHKLYVLSIYHPARGFDLSAANINPIERHELLVSARAVLRLRQDDASIWSNWDLIMITWAAILLLRGVEDGITHQDDLHLIQTHLHSLERSYQSTASIHSVLSQRLESSMQAMHTPPNTSSALAFPGPMVDDTWTIFDQEIMTLANPPWLFQDPNDFTQSQKPQATGQHVRAELPSVTYNSEVLTNGAPPFGVNTQWSSVPQLQGSLPSSLSRIFGNENAPRDNGLI
ncbi:hypothetical protein N7462_008519 [Penicillium macrosclerotiorum]|uniref:uncharacterized protein n=1 Tax=Penicillium macrosclerotiorum TaxID=303699 RepID=UPI002549869B|nr:uncharacterized protein N7462_008519 [Penicillium macrosclerotiorum]KAJ5675622.1 hypothetical protein N7462_008519 [Penicillium macrosclerotiorum]